MIRSRASCVILLFCVAFYLNPFLLQNVTGNVDAIAICDSAIAYYSNININGSRAVCVLLLFCVAFCLNLFLL